MLPLGRVLFGQMDEVVFGKPAAEAITAQVHRLGATRVFLMVSNSLNRNTDEIDKVRRALGPSAHIKSDRERVRDGASPNREDERSPVGEDCEADGVQTRQCRRENVMTIEG